MKSFWHLVLVRAPCLRFSKLSHSSFTALSPVLNQWFVCLFDEICLCLDSEQCDCRELIVFCSSAWSGTWHAQTSDILVGDEWMNWCWSWNSSSLAASCKELTHWKDPDAGKDWGQGEKGTTEDEMVGWHHRLDGHEFKWTPGVGDGQGGLALLRFMGSQRVRHDWATELKWMNNCPVSWKPRKKILERGDD